MRDQGRTFRILWLTAWLSTGILFLGSISHAQPIRSYILATDVTDHDRDFLFSLINERDRQYQQRFDAQEKALTAALSAAKEAVDKANAASEKRFDSVNEFRNSLKDQAAAFLPRNEYAASIKQLSDLITTIQATQVPRSEHETRWQAEQQQFKNIQDRIEQLSQRAYQISGQSEGSAWLWGIIAGGIGLAAAMITVVLNIIRRDDKRERT